MNLICLQHDKVETEKSSYEMLETPIKDKSMLNTQAQKLCENIDVSWMTPTCATDSNDRKRSRYTSPVQLQKHLTVILGYDSDKTNL